MGHDVGKHEREAGRRRAGAPSNRSSIDEQTDWVLRDIESDLADAAPLRLGAHSRVAGGRSAIGDITPEDIDPQDVDAAPAMPLPANPAGELSQVDECVEELPEALEMARADDASGQHDDGHESPARDDEASAARRRRRLRGMLICALAVLVALAALIAVFVWQAPSSSSPDAGRSDTEALDDASAGTNAVTFEPVQNDAIEPLVDVCGLTLADTIASVSSLAMDADEVTAYEDERVEALEQLCEGTLVDENGAQVADVGFGLDEEGVVVYVYCLFDLDELAVADATFDELVGSDVVAASVLQALGLDDDALAQAELTAEDAQGSADVKTAAFSGATGLEEPATWELVETYDSSVGRALGDNRVMRTLCVEFY